MAVPKVVYSCVDCDAPVTKQGCRCPVHARQHRISKYGSWGNSLGKSVQPATEHPSMSTIAWAAGVYEGEGHCRRGKTTVRATVTQKDDWLLHRFRALFGGTIYARKAEGCGYWYLSGPRARGFLMTVYSRLSPRRKAQVRLALAE